MKDTVFARGNELPQPYRVHRRRIQDRMAAALFDGDTTGSAIGLYLYHQQDTALKPLTNCG